MINLIFIALIIAAPAGLAVPPQDDADLPPGIVAAASDIAVTEAEFYAYVIAEHGGSDTGLALLDQIINETAIRQEAKRRGMKVSDRAVEARAQDLDRAIQAHFNGEKGLLEYIQEQGVNEQEFFAALRLSIAHEEMTRADFDLDDDVQVPVEKLNLWLKELLAGKEVVKNEIRPGTDVDAKAAADGGAMAVVDGEAVTREEYGRRLASHLDGETISGLLTEMVGIRLIPIKAKELGLALKEEEIETEIRMREKALQAKEGFSEISYADFLKATTGETLDDLRRSPKFRAEVLMKKIGRAMLTEEDLRRFFDDNRQAYERAHGRAARVATIFLKGVRFPNEHVNRTFEDAMEELKAIAKRLEKGESAFENMARIYSEHDSGKKGGDLGFLSPGDEDLGEIAAAAVEAEPGAILGPFRTAEGCHLVRVLEKRGPVEYSNVKKLVIADARQNLYREMIRDAGIRKRY